MADDVDFRRVDNQLAADYARRLKGDGWRAIPADRRRGDALAEARLGAAGTQFEA